MYLGGYKECFKVYMDEGIVLICQSPNKNHVRFNQNRSGVILFLYEYVFYLRAVTNESKKTRNKKQNGLAHLRFLVCVTPKQNKTLLDSRIKFLAKHV